MALGTTTLYERAHAHALEASRLSIEHANATPGTSRERELQRAARSEAEKALKLFKRADAAKTRIKPKTGDRNHGE